MALVFLLFAPLSLLFDLYESDFLFGLYESDFVFDLYESDFLFGQQALDLFLIQLFRFVNWVRRVAVWWVYFRFPTSHELKSRFFCARINSVVYSKLHALHGLFKLVVVSNCAFCVYQHSCGHQPGSRTHGKV